MEGAAISALPRLPSRGAAPSRDPPRHTTALLLRPTTTLQGPPHTHHRTLAMLWLTSYTTCMSRSSGVALNILAKAWG